MHIRAEKVTINIYGKTPELPRMVWPEEQATDEDVSITPPEIDTSTGHDDHADMTQEAVAEVARLRRGLKELKGDLDHSAMCAKALGERAAVEKSAAERITRILDGTHE